MNQAWKALREYLGISKPPFLHRPGLEILHQNIRAFQETKQDSAPLRLCEIKPDRLLVAINTDEIAGIARSVGMFHERRAPIACLIALRRFEFDHLSAVIGKNHGAIGPSEHASEIDHAQTRQSSLRGTRFFYNIRVCC